MADYSSGNAASLTSYLGNAGIKQASLPTNVWDAWKLSEKPSFMTTTNIPDFKGDVLASPATAGGGGGAEAWVFITAPGTVSYTVSSQVNRVDIFGTNSPPVIVSSKGMRDLTLSEALAEGFTIGKSVQPHIDKLESLMDISVNSKEGFVSVPVYNVFAGPAGGGKNYGMYVIESVEIEEQMRDVKGNATRAMVGVSLKQVPEYQVGKGIDQAGASTGGGALDASKFTNQAASQASKVASNAKTTAAAAGAGAAAAGGGNAAATAATNQIANVDPRTFASTRP